MSRAGLPTGRAGDHYPVMSVEGHGGDLIAETLRGHGIEHVFTLSGGHIFPIFDGLHTRGMHTVDVRHELTGAFAAEAYGKLSRRPGVCAFTAGPGVLNAATAMQSALRGGTPMLMLGGRAPQVRWGQGGLQEMDHVPIFAPASKRAATLLDISSMSEEIADALALASARRRGPVFLDSPADTLFLRATVEIAACRAAGSGSLQGSVEDAVRSFERAERPVVLFGSDVWMDGAEASARALIERSRVPCLMNGMGRGILPADHALAFAAARGHALTRADLVIVVGTPLDFRLGFGAFGDAEVVHVVDSPSEVGHHASPSAWIAGPISDALDALATADVRDRDGWIAELRAQEESKRAASAADLKSGRAPIHPARVYGELVPRLDRDAIVVNDGGDFVSWSGKLMPTYEAGAWLDPGAFGALGTSPGYALAAGLLHPGRQIVVMLGDGAAGFSMGDWDTLVRWGIDVTLVCGNNGVWGLEKGPQEFLYGHSTAADLRPETRYDEVMRALGGHGELVRDPEEIGPAIERALATQGPSLVNVITDPGIPYARSSLLI